MHCWEIGLYAFVTVRMESLTGVAALTEKRHGLFNGQLADVLRHVLINQSGFMKQQERSRLKNFTAYSLTD